MAKRLASIITIIILMLSLVSCTGGDKQASSKGEVISPNGGDEPKLTIITNGAEYTTLRRSDVFNQYVKKFEKNYGVSVEINNIMDIKNPLTSEEADEYLKKLSTKLLNNDGVELIFCNYFHPNALIEQGAVLDLRDKVANVDKIYDELLQEQVYYIPVEMGYSGKPLYIDALKSIGIQDVSFDWDSKQFYKLYDEWYAARTIYFNSAEYYNVIYRYIDIYSLFDKHSNKLKIDEAVLEKKINDVRSLIFGGKYILNPNYKYENYYNMLYEFYSQEYKETNDMYEQNVRDNQHFFCVSTYSGNLYRAEEICYFQNNQHVILMPEFKDKDTYLSSWGFMVNKKGKNLDLAYEFINGLLDDEVQMQMFVEIQNYYYPVNKNIEDKIKAIESEKGLDSKAIEIKDYALQELKSGRCKQRVSENSKLTKLYEMLDKDLVKFIFADEPYSHEKLSAELQKLEDKYNIWLNE